MYRYKYISDKFAKKCSRPSLNEIKKYESTLNGHAQASKNI